MMLTSACQKEIQFDLNSANPKLVIEGYISDRGRYYYVRLNYSVNYDYIDSVSPPIVHGAEVMIKDSNTNKTEILKEWDDYSGFYGASSDSTVFVGDSTVFVGTPGHTYILMVKVDNIQYTAVSKMPFPVLLDTLTIAKDVRRRFGEGSRPSLSDRNKYQLTAKFKDPIGENNYYRFAVSSIRKDKSINVLSDRFRDGKEISRDISMDTFLYKNPGDQVTLELQSIDKGAYDYLRTLRMVMAGSASQFFSASPGNPISNINGGALGYFSAYSTSRKEVLIPQE
jgi:hypothetical protein